MKIPTPNMLVGAYIREMRKAKGYKLREFCRQVNISPQYLSELERGIKGTSQSAISILAPALELDVSELLARGGHIPDNVKQYLMEHPAAGTLLQRLVTYNLSDKSIRLFINHLDAVVERSKKRKKEIENLKKEAEEKKKSAY